MRTDCRSFCLVNIGSSRAIVMGISGKPAELLDLSKVRKRNIPVIKRFSGGGTVIVDENTLFVTFIIAKEHLELPPYPEPILRWSAGLYAKAWKIPGFTLRENDYCIGDRKCGGNAQYMKKERWTHHTSFLWDYDPENMQTLLLPSKQPAYRQDRSHDTFLSSLKSHGSDPKARIAQIKSELEKHFSIQAFDLDSYEKRPHRQATCFIELAKDH